MFRKIFKKQKYGRNKTKPRRRKRTIFATIALALSLRFGNKAVQERIIDDQEFCSLEDNDRQVILAKTGDRAPSTRIS